MPKTLFASSRARSSRASPFANQLAHCPGNHAQRRSTMATTAQMCLTPPIVAPFTSVQLMLSSSFSSTKPTEHTPSPRTRYSPRGTSTEGSGSSGSRMILSTASLSTCKKQSCVSKQKQQQHGAGWWCRKGLPGGGQRAAGVCHTRLVELSAAVSVPTRTRESAVTISTFSAKRRARAAWLAPRVPQCPNACLQWAAGARVARVRHCSLFRYPPRVAMAVVLSTTTGGGKACAVSSRGEVVARSGQSRGWARGRRLDERDALRC